MGWKWNEEKTSSYQIMEEDQEVAAPQEIDFCTLGMFIIGKISICVLIGFSVYFLYFGFKPCTAKGLPELEICQSWP